jgi:hypothetical protein
MPELELWGLVGFEQRLLREAAEADVALSHVPDCECSVCSRVRLRNKAKLRRLAGFIEPDGSYGRQVAMEVDDDHAYGG